jgi:hypothetical protein
MRKKAVKKPVLALNKENGLTLQQKTFSFISIEL